MARRPGSLPSVSLAAGCCGPLSALQAGTERQREQQGCQGSVATKQIEGSTQCSAWIVKGEELEVARQDSGQSQVGDLEGLGWDRRRCRCLLGRESAARSTWKNRKQSSRHRTDMRIEEEGQGKMVCGAGRRVFSVAAARRQACPPLMLRKTMTSFFREIIQNGQHSKY